MTINKRQILYSVGIILAAALIVFADLADQAQRREAAGAAATQEYAEQRVDVMAQVQTDRRINQRAGQILAYSRGRIRLDKARAIARELEVSCDGAITADLVMRLIARESAWDPRALGAAGEIGLCQLKPSTAGIPAADLTDPVRNVEAGIAHLRKLHGRLGEVGLTLAAFNAGLYSPGVRYARAILGE